MSGLSKYELRSNHELVGVLSEIEKNGENTTLIFSNIKKIKIPTSMIDSLNLKEKVGLRIGLVNIDNKYFVRKIK